MQDHQTSLESSIGCGLLGCVGDLIVGFFGGGLLLILLSLAVAILSPDPPPPVRHPPADSRLTVQEDFLNRFVQTSAQEASTQEPSTQEGSVPEGVQIDILPGRQFNIAVDTSVSVLGTTVPIQVVGLFELRLSGPTVEIHLLDTKVSDVTLPAELTEFFAGTLVEVNKELNIALDNMSAALGIPLVIVDINSDETTFWLEAEVQ
jgi:hypothetical protein